MEFSKVRSTLEQTCQFPVDQSSLLNEVGDVEFESPTGESVRLETLLRRSDESVYRSPRAVETTLAATLDDSFVGRGQYDDRSHNPVRSQDVSF